MGDKGKKASFRKACKPFSMLHGQLIYNNTRLVISSSKRQHTIIRPIMPPINQSINQSINQCTSKKDSNCTIY